MNATKLSVTLALLAGGLLGAVQSGKAQEVRAGGTRASAETLLLGQRIYREGIGASGQPLDAVGAVQARLAGKDASCASCHRRSGYGSNEGKYVIRPIIGPALQSEQSVPVSAPRVKARVGIRQRPPYDEALLARAIRGGVDAAGERFDRVMPRYALSDEEMTALTAYLFSLGNKPSPGVDDENIHFATVIQPGVSAEQRRAMLEVMEAFFRDKTANMRSDERRREVGNMRMYRAYRKWMLHVWELNGPSDTWAAQLEASYEKQPVFALIGGLGNTSWKPIHEFCERREIPSVFPQVNLPVLSGPNDYTLYLSRGVALDAEVLAKFLRDRNDAGTVLQVYRKAETGLLAAEAFRVALGADVRFRLEDAILEGEATEGFWQTLQARKHDALVLWLGQQDISRLPGTSPAASAAIYLSSRLLAGKLPDASRIAASSIRVIQSSDLQPARDPRLLRNRIWLRNKGIPIRDDEVQINTQFALSVASDALSHMLDSFSRDYFIERLEHSVTRSTSPSTFQNVSLGPGQRFAGKGSAIVELVAAPKEQLKSVSGWIVP